MIITMYGSTSGVPKRNYIKGMKVQSYALPSVKGIHYSYYVKPREMEYEVLESHDNPNWPRSRFKLTMKDVSFEAMIPGISEEECMKNLLEDYPSMWCDIEKNRDDKTYLSYWLQAICIDHEVIKGNDITVLWDREKQCFREN